ncbi:hypothetical protein WV31_13065 [Magnetospirillum sp. ME-1]|uniref:alcohol dehydrogenase catalytic domain-containing protein n=1 Tax=Magnetospirillum sp. ME-1 TaxID=1639348 RepID=UPI000A17EE77|nr:alcohol dehydrogenase catalytic domain-containing protein [Magnetospirillum sp. ME-1]ARJ66532.1 hypothetical protein WV31_13065 [Magnetospirillum sp. ME-1]
METPAPIVETSVIVRAFNEEKHLPALFEALAAQRYRDFEVLLVDSGSLDRSREIAAEHGARVIRISSHDFTFGYSLNVGIRAALGRFMAIVSAHTVPADPDWMERLVAPLRQDDVAMSYGRQLGVESSKFSEVEDFLRTFGTERLDLKPPRFFANNANSAIRKDLWRDYPFDELLTGLEDIDWAKHWMERGKRVIYEPEAALYHIHEETWRQVRRRYYREAVAARRIGIRRRADVPGEMGREILWTALDFAKAVLPGSNPCARRLGLGGRLAEIALFRANKLYGTMRGLLEAHPLETAEEREDILFDRHSTAVVVHGPGRATLEDVAIPEVKPGDALIRVAHVAVCATDLEILNGTLGYFKNGLAHYPIVPGHEFSGRIAAIGQNVAHLAENDPVVVECIQSCGICPECLAGNFIGCAERTEVGVFRRDGAYAHFVVVPARFVHKLEPGTDLAAAALAEPLAVVLKGLRRLAGVARLDDAARRPRCGVVGAGPIGHICARVLAARGLDVTVFDRAPERLAFFAGSGIATSADLAGLAECGAIVEATGSPEALDTTLHRSPAGAAILLLGLPYGQRSFSFEAIAAYDKVVVGSVGSTAADFDEAIRLLPTLDFSRLGENRMPLDQFAAAWTASKRPGVLKVILDVDA